MAPENKKPADAEDQAPDSPKPSTPDSRKLALAKYALPAALVLSVVANLAGVFYFNSLAKGARQAIDHEIPLGDYRFVAEEHEPGQVTEAEFSLFVELVHQAEKPGRQLLDQRRQKVRQDVEELLRMAHGGNFNDPTLKELKEQLQKRINMTLGLPAVRDVIVTELQMQRTLPPVRRGDESPSAVPWVEPVASRLGTL